jgi:nucleotide-binding universal stress UspA family protein
MKPASSRSKTAVKTLTHPRQGTDAAGRDRRFRFRRVRAPNRAPISGLHVRLGGSAPLDFVDSELCSGDPRAALLEAAAKHRPLLLVLGDRGAGGFPGLRLGSTTDEVVRSGAAPVLVVRDGGSG